jgi:integrase
MTRKRARGNGEGSIFPYRSGYAAYVWVITPDNRRRRKWVYGKTRDEVVGKWQDAKTRARQGPVPTATPSLDSYLTYWLAEVVKPHVKPATYAMYETMVRVHIVPALGRKRLDRLTIRDVQAWVNQLATTCQCCAQGKDKARPVQKRRCCAIGKCCKQHTSARTIQAARNVLRTALNHAMTEELLARNPAALTRIRGPRKQRREPWTVDEARRFLESAQQDNDPLYAAYVLVLVLGLRRGEALGLTWNDVRAPAAELHINWQLQRVGRSLLHSDTKTEGSAAVLPLPDICLTALKIRREQQDRAKAVAAAAWQDFGLVFTTRWGTPIEPRNFSRSFDARCVKAGVRRIRVHDTRHTCGSLLAALDVHPRVAMQILRHSKISITMEIYTEVPDASTRDALRRLGDSLA